jgi:hypothetical protein
MESVIWKLPNRMLMNGEFRTNERVCDRNRHKKFHLDSFFKTGAKNDEIRHVAGLTSGSPFLVFRNTNDEKKAKAQGRDHMKRNTRKTMRVCVISVANEPPTRATQSAGA